MKGPCTKTCPVRAFRIGHDDGVDPLGDFFRNTPPCDQSFDDLCGLVAAQLGIEGVIVQINLFQTLGEPVDPRGDDNRHFAAQV